MIHVIFPPHIAPTPAGTLPALTLPHLANILLGHTLAARQLEHLAPASSILKPLRLQTLQTLRAQTPRTVLHEPTQRPGLTAPEAYPTQRASGVFHFASAPWQAMSCPEMEDLPTFDAIL